ncbi:MAG: tetratricopeptide repeat protein [Bryobacterales bacterium]|nr:tetratricopeptide repeat protein [Bryobacterales bacterium]
MRFGYLAPVAAAAVLLSQVTTLSKNDEQLWRHRNRGKAYYENPTTQLKAIDEFRKALELAPDSTRDRLNYGLALFRGGKTEEGIAELKKVQAADGKLPHTWFNLGIHFKKQGEAEEAAAMFRKMVELVPSDPVSHYNLAVLYKLQNKLPESMALFEKAARLGPSLAAPHFQLYNAFRLAGKREDAARELALFQELKKAQEASGNTEDMEWNEYAEIYDPIEPAVQAAPLIAPQAVKFTERKLAEPLGGEGAGLLVFDADADGRADLLAWSSRGGVLFGKGAATVPAPALQAGRYFAAADVDNDGYADLAMITAEGAQLARNRKGTFPVAEVLAQGSFRLALWLDYDHDYDFDLLLFGEKNVLLRNQGEAGFADRTGDFPFVAGMPAAGIAYRTVPDTKGVDVLVTYTDRESVLYRDLLAGKFRAESSRVPQGAMHLRAEDWNADSVFDVTYVHQGKLNVAAAVNGPYVFVDAANTGSVQLHSVPAQAMAAADFNGDGRTDVAVLNERGVFLQTNSAVTANRQLAVRLTGVKNLKLAQGAEVEVRSGRFYQKQRYEGYPLLFGLKTQTQIDAVRITWPNGLIQNETAPIAGRAVEYKEAPRLSGSCPMIYTWDGSEFRFLTDVLGVAPLGASSGDGRFFPADHDEYVFIPGDVLKARGGVYDLRITEELSEVTYLDQLKLIAVDHPADVEVFSNDKWKSPPFAEFRLFTSRRRMTPVRAAVDGRDTLGALLGRDRRYAGPARRTMQNTAETFVLEIDFGPRAPADNAVLVLHGWVDWADGSAFRNLAQQPGRELTPPYLQVRDASGEWRTVIEDMGIPSGKAKTIAVDLGGKFLSASREVRIVTNLCVYWDQVFLAVQEPAPVRKTEAALAEAELRFHGFSTAVIDADRRQPETFLYRQTLTEAPWNPTPGMYTRFGDVRALLGQADDRYVVMGSGDEVGLRFKALPAPGAGWKRDFLLYVDGWAKDADANTAFSQSVEPLPFHGMSQYPYPAAEKYPSGETHSDYRKRYQTRPAAQLVKQIAP